MVGPDAWEQGVSAAREEMLRRIRTALGRPEGAAGDGAIVDRAGAVHVPRAYRTEGDQPPGAPALLDLLADRLEDYRATVVRCAPDAVDATVLDVLNTRRIRRLVVPPRQAAQVPAELVELVLDHPGEPLTVEQLDGADGVLTGCAVAVAETGTIVLDGSPDQGRRAITLVPDYHLVVVRAEQVVQTVPEALRRLDPRRPLTWISGPSATSDIELSRVEGVHGPRTLDVVLVESGP